MFIGEKDREVCNLLSNGPGKNFYFPNKKLQTVPGDLWLHCLEEGPDTIFGSFPGLRSAQSRGSQSAAFRWAASAGNLLNTHSPAASELPGVGPASGLYHTLHGVLMPTQVWSHWSWLWAPTFSISSSYVPTAPSKMLCAYSCISINACRISSDSEWKGRNDHWGTWRW